MKLKPLIGLTKSFIKDLSSFFNELMDMKFDLGDSLVSFDVVSLYTKIPIKEAIDVIFHLTHPDTTTFFYFEGEFYKITYGVAMGSPLSHIIANLFMDGFESKVLSSTILNLKIWKIFVDDTYGIWLHGPNMLNIYFHHINNQSNSINFNMEQEFDGFPCFLDVLISMKVDGSFFHQVYQNKTHIE